MHKLISLTGLLLATGVLVSCDPGQPEGSAELVVQGKAAALTNAEYRNLDPEQQYRVANKLYGTLLRGVPVDEFFDLSSGDMASAGVQNPTFLSDARQTLRTPLAQDMKLAVDAAIDGIDDQGNPDPDEALYRFSRDRPREIPLARIKEYPVSRDMYVNWMAYFLSNTILFSPATEMESTDIIDAQRVFRFLVTRLGEGDSIRAIIRSNLPSLHRWRVSRSAENHALEAYELYLGLFETEEDSLRGGIACKDYYLTDEGDDYLIDITDFPNTVPQLILGEYYVTSCDDLYDVIAGHPLVIPRVTEVIINYLMAGRSQQDRLAMINSITSANPETFEDIFTAILFSKEYLLYTERPRSFEENLMSSLDRLHWHVVTNRFPVDENIFHNMARIDSSSTLALRKMNWDVMSLKIGRLPDVPLDGLSFANYHKAMRESLLMNISSFSGNNNRPSGLIFDDDGDLHPFLETMTLDSYLDYLFLSLLDRGANTDEKTDLAVLLSSKGFLLSVDSVVIPHSSSFDNIAVIVFDYISRLPEFYYFKLVAEPPGGAQ